MFSARRSSVSSIDRSLDGDDNHEYESDSESRIAAREAEEWEESLKQLELVVSVFLIPALGKWLGRRWSTWLYARYSTYGLGRTFFFGERLGLHMGRLWKQTSF